MKLVEEARVAFGRVSGESLASQIGQCVIAFAAVRSGEKPVPVGDAAEILVRHRNGMLEGVEKDRIGGFRADPG
jgi:hypothetical protein